MRRSIPSCLLAVVALLPSADGAAAPDAASGVAAEAVEAPADAYLRGFVESWLIHAHHLGPDQVGVTVRDGVVTLSGEVDSREQIDVIVATVASFAGVVEVVNRLEVMGTEAAMPGGTGQETSPQAAGQAGRWRTWRWRRPNAGRKTVAFPVGDLFTAPLADQKQPRFHTTYQRYQASFGTFDIASVGFGENFGLVRWPREREGDGWQVGISGAVFAIFNLDAPSKDLLNADYIVGFPISFRSSPWSARMRIFHQSSHLGDEFLLLPQPGPPVTRINLSYEAIEVLGSWERRGFRAYGGGIRIFSSETPLGRDRLQAGADYRGNPLGWRTARVIAGFDLEAWDETDWERDYSLKAGLLFRGPYGDARTTQFLLEYYSGHSPHGQFFNLEVKYFGLGIAYAF
jgi:hypothetical protein